MSRSTPFLPISDRALDAAVLTALLLTGDLRLAENAVADAIRVLEPEELSSESLLIGSIQCALQLQRGHEPHVGAVRFLPLELKCVLRLAGDIRGCFVLRVLAGFSSSDCARLLHVSEIEVEMRACMATRELERWSERVPAPLHAAPLQLPVELTSQN